MSDHATRIVSGSTAQLSITVKPPRLPGNRWLNLILAISSSPYGLDISSVRLGRFDRPANLVVPVLTFAMDIVLGDGLGTHALNGIKHVSVRGKSISVGLNISPDIRKNL